MHYRGSAIGHTTHLSAIQALGSLAEVFVPGVFVSSYFLGAICQLASSNDYDDSRTDKSFPSSNSYHSRDVSTRYTRSCVAKSKVHSFWIVYIRVFEFVRVRSFALFCVIFHHGVLPPKAQSNHTPLVQEPY